MTQRRLIVPAADRAKAMLQDLLDRVTQLERGTILLGQVSVASGFTVAGVQVTVVDTGGGHVDLVFTNTRIKPGSPTAVAHL